MTLASVKRMSAESVRRTGFGLQTSGLRPEKWPEARSPKAEVFIEDLPIDVHAGLDQRAALNAVDRAVGRPQHGNAVDDRRRVQEVVDVEARLPGSAADANHLLEAHVELAQVRQTGRAA